MGYDGKMYEQPTEVPDLQMSALRTPVDEANPSPSCEVSTMQAAKVGRKSQDLRVETIADIRRNSIVTETGCWEWQLRRWPYGYGVAFFMGLNVPAHRAAYALVYGPSILNAKGLVVCHECDNPPCVNPEHLFAGTQGDNVRDSYAKGRHISPAAYVKFTEFCVNGHPRATFWKRDAKGKPSCKECNRNRWRRIALLKKIQLLGRAPTEEELSNWISDRVTAALPRMIATRKSRYPHHFNMITAFGETMTQAEWSRRFGVSALAIARRIRAGISPEIAVSVRGKICYKEAINGT
jgi:hypothetical protein